MKYIKTYDNVNLEEHLINSIKSDRLYKVKELIEEKGVDKNFKYGNNQTPLMWAVLLHRIDIVDYLISINVELNLKDYFRGETALMKAALNSLSQSHFNILCMLIDAGADWNIKNNNDRDFLDLIIFEKIREQVIDKYPEKYQEYLMKKKC